MGHSALKAKHLLHLNPNENQILLIGAISGVGVAVGLDIGGVDRESF